MYSINNSRNHIYVTQPPPAREENIEKSTVLLLINFLPFSAEDL